MPKTKKQMEGEGLKDVLHELNKFLKKHKVISKGAKIAEHLVPDKHKKKVKAVGTVAEHAGYGKPRRAPTKRKAPMKKKPATKRYKKGQGLKLAGQR